MTRPSSPARRRLLLCGALAALAACDPPADPRPDPNIVRRPDNLQENRGFVSPVILSQPIYACAQTVVVKGFIPGARIDVFAAGNPAPIGSAQSWLSDGQIISVSAPFTAGQKITARQTFDGATGNPSNEVTVTSHTEDYPAGLPRPRLDPVPCLNCGRSVGITDVVPGAWIKIFSEAPRAGGGFDPPVEIGNTSAPWYAILTTPFQTGARIHAESGLCTDRSPASLPQIVQPEPATIPAPVLDPVHEGVNIVTVWGPGRGPLLNGATLEVRHDPGAALVGGQPTPGGGQQVFISPAASGGGYFATQALCARSGPSSTVPVVPCGSQPPARVRPPMPGDTQIEVTDYIPGARIVVYVNGVEIADGGPPLVALSRPLAEGETVVVLQQIGDCRGTQAYQLPVTCPLGGDGSACSSEWPAFRHNALRSGSQPIASALSNPNLVKKLQVRWRFPATGNVGPFRASPVVHGGRVFVGSGDGHLYTLDAATGALQWQYPAMGQPALVSQFLSNPSSYGIAASAFVTSIREPGDAVIFAAPDPSIGAGLGSGRLFALRPADGAEIWKSPELARLTGLSPSSTTELHEQFGYSSPLVHAQRVYGGIANHGDNPIQRGRVVAVNLADGLPAPGFTFEATSTRGGGIWSSLAAGLDGSGVYATTGNVRCWNGGCQGEPSTNHSLAMLRLDAGSGALVWKHQPVPFELDDDPDWATGVHLLRASCGQVALSTMKDGWSYAVNAAGGPAASVRWQFPATGFPFAPGDGTAHGDSRFLVPGAVWNDVFFTQAGGEDVAFRSFSGFGRLHALNVCAGRTGRVRWTAELPGATVGEAYQMGPPSVTRGIVYVGTAGGRLVALADPSVWPAQGSRCSRPTVDAAACVANGYTLVPVPTVLRDVPLGAGPILTEPALAGGRVFVATTGGVVFMLEPVP